MGRVAKDYLQKYGESFDKTFVPVVQLNTIRMIPPVWSQAASKQMQVKHLDIKTMFLHGEAAEELYMV